MRDRTRRTRGRADAAVTSTGGTIGTVPGVAVASGASAPGGVLTPAAARRAARRRRRAVTGVSAVVVVSLVGAGAAFAVNRGSDGRYRTATASTGEVTQTVDAAGTVASAARADAAFSVAGTVATVDVAVGDTVGAGDVLATLDLTELEDAVEAAQEKVAQAEQTLEDDLASQTSTGSSASAATATGSATVTPSAAGTGGGVVVRTGLVKRTSSTTSQPTTSSTAGTASTSPALAQALEAVALAQQALLDGYDAAAAALESSSTSVVGSQEACSAFLAATEDDLPSGEGDEAGEGTGDGTEGGTVDLAAALTTCQEAVTAALTSQTDVDGAQHSLLDLAAQLDAAVQTAQEVLVAEQGNGSGTQAPGGGSGSGSGAGSGSGDASGGAPPVPSGGSSGGGTGAAAGSGGTSGAPGADAGGSVVASAERILADRAAIEVAEAQLAIAQADAQRSTLTSPVAGTVAQVALAVGDQVEASSTSAVVTVLGTDGYVVETTVPLTAVVSLAVGQDAAVTVSDDPTVRTGVVSSIGVLSTSTSQTPEYPVTIALDPQDDTLYEGSSAQASVTVAGGTDVLVVPTSAVRPDGTARTVSVLRGGEVTVVTVEVGAVGQEVTEITAGLEEGDEVVLADLAQEMVSDEEASTGLTGLGADSGGSQQPGQVPGGGQPPGGGTGGPPSRG